MSPTYSRTVSPQAWASALQGAVQTITTAMQLDFKTTPLHVSLKHLMQIDVRQCLILYVPQLMQLDLRVSHSPLIPYCHFVYANLCKSQFLV